MNATADNPKKHLPRYFLFLAFAVLVTSYNIYLFYTMAHLPYTGEYSLLREDTNFEILAVDPGSPADLAGLRKGDKMHKLVSYTDDVINIHYPDYTISYNRSQDFALIKEDVASHQNTSVSK